MDGRWLWYTLQCGAMLRLLVPATCVQIDSDQLHHRQTPFGPQREFRTSDFNYPDFGNRKPIA